MGSDVTFVTVALSWLSRLRRDYRLQYPVRAEARQLRELGPGLRSYVYFTPYHPANLRHPALNWLSSPLFARYGRRLPRELETVLQRADLVVFESTPGLLLTRRVRELNSSARLVYRVSDDLRLLQNHPVVLRAEERYAPAFDLISVPSPNMTHLFPEHAQLRVQSHGLDLAAIGGCAASPYPTDGPNIVFTGNARFDHDFLSRAARMFPGWRFHIIGPIPGLPDARNVVAHGELPFQETLPYVKHANAGLQTLAYSPGAESFTDSLKVQQYTYCGLGIVAPEFLRSWRPNVFYYRPGDDQSIAAALESAVAFDAALVDRTGIQSWDELALELAA